MNTVTRTIFIGVVLADIVAVMYFGGRWLTTGTFLRAQDVQQEYLVVESVKNGGSLTVAAKATPVFDPLTYIPDVANGKKLSAKCKACHTFNEGGPNRTGPNLWGTMGRAIASVTDFKYSDVLQQRAGEHGVWSEEILDEFTKAPKEWAEGTAMQYNGLRKPEQRADLIAWLKTLQ